MKELIEALQIFLSVKNVDYPTHCEHDKLFIVGYEKQEFTKSQIEKLEELSFSFDEEDELFYSYKYGSC